MRNRESGVSLTEVSLVILFVSLFSISSITSLKDKVEASLWLVTLSIISPETYLPDGRTQIDVWAPASAFRIYGGIEIEHNWCRVILYRYPNDPSANPRVERSDIQECADSPP